MPSQQQLRWSQLRVGITVIVASITLAVLIFLMTNTTGIFTKKMTLYAYIDNAGGLRTGAPVRLQGVDIGNVTAIRVVPHRDTPVQIQMRISTKNNYNRFIKTDTLVQLSTAGVLGETFVDLDSTRATGAPVRNDGTLKAEAVPDLTDVVRASQGTLQNVDILVKRANRIMSAVENAQGSVGQLIYDKKLYNNLNSAVNQVQSMLNDINSGKGSIGKLIKDQQLYDRANDAITRLDKMMDDVDAGKGTIGKLIKDPALYNNANQTLAKANELITSINEGHGALGKLAKDPEFAKKLDTIVTQLSAITTSLNEGQGTAGRLLKDPSLYTNADQMLVESRELIKAVRQDPKKYLTIRMKIF